MRSIESLTEVRDLHAAIQKLTGRVPVSTDPRYLRERLAALKARKQAGEQLKHRDDPAAPMSVSLPLSARKALSKILDSEKLGVSELARRAFALWAAENGYKAEAKLLEG